MIKAIIFDFFGVIGLSTFQLVAERQDINADQRLQLTDLHKSLDNGFITEDAFLHGYSEIIQMPYDEFVSKVYESKDRFGVSSGMIDLVRELKKDYKIGLLSNVSPSAYHSFIEPLRGEFDEVVVSYMLHVAKPNEFIFEYAAHKLAVDVSECVMIDDTEINCEGARAAGMVAINHVTLSETKALLLDILN